MLPPVLGDTAAAGTVLGRLVASGARSRAPGAQGVHCQVGRLLRRLLGRRVIPGSLLQAAPAMKRLHSSTVFSLSGPPPARAEVTPRVAGGSKCVIHPSFPQTSLAIKSWLPQTSEFGVARCEARAKLGPIASGMVDLPLKVFFPSSEAHGKREKSRLKSSLKLSSAARARGR